MTRPHIVIVTPALAAANNGNWQTARRWAQMLQADYRVQLVDRWPGAGADPGTDTAADAHAEAPVAMIALHARRSAPSIAAWRAAHPARPLVVVLTGTDLYRDIASDASAQRSLALADRLVVLQALGRDSVPAAHRAKTVVCLQSSAFRGAAAPPPKPRAFLRALMVGHLRDEKAPETYFEAARRLAGRSDIRLDHIGAALDPALGTAAQATMAACPHYRWLGALPHGETLRRIRAAHVLVHCSRMEGGAHVVIEAVVRGTPVIASRIEGNLGLLGAAYEGIFPVGDAAALAGLLQRARDEPTMLQRLQAQCAQRAPLFLPAHERATLRGLMTALTAGLLA